MKFKNTLLLFGLFILLLAAVYFFELRGPEDNEEDLLISLSTDSVEKIIFRTEDQTIQFEKEGEDWLISEPIEAKADKYEVNRLADDFTNLRIERVVEEDPADLEKYGIPQKQVEIYFRDQEGTEKILIGLENPLDNTFFAKKVEETKVVLIPSSLKGLLEKNVFDFRQKDIFQFQSDQAKRVKLRANDIQWEAEKTEEDWFLKNPVDALAQKSKINEILNALSNLKATDFLSENKQEEEMSSYGLDEPDYEIEIDFPVENKKVIYSLHQKDENTYATSSISPKIIRVENSILEDLKQEPGELRDKDIANFYTWEVKKLFIRKGELSLKMSKDDEDAWQFEQPPLQGVDEEKIQSFLRRLEGLESQEFVDPPLNLADFGLDPPETEITVFSGKEGESPKELNVRIGHKEAESNLVFVQNTRFDYVFKVDSSFLKEIPQKAEDWQKQTEEEKKEIKD
jgi:hypothetical protein